MGTSKVIDAFVAYQFIKILSTPWKETKAFELGIIDENGNVLKKSRNLTSSDEKKAYTIVHRLVWNIKRLLDKLPPTRTRIGSFSTALWMLKEHSELVYGADFETAHNAFLNYLTEEYGINTDNLLTENRSSDTLEPGKYIIKFDVDGPGGSKKNDTFIIRKRQKADQEFAGDYIFMVTNDRTKDEVMVSNSDIELTEEFHEFQRSPRGRRDLTGVYINPCKYDFRQILKDSSVKVNEIRFFGNQKEMYAWHGMDHIHNEMIDALGVKKSNYTYFGSLEVNGDGSIKKFIALDSHTYAETIDPKAVKELKKYIKNEGNSYMFKGLFEETKNSDFKVIYENRRNIRDAVASYFSGKNKNKASQDIQRMVKNNSLKDDVAELMLDYGADVDDFEAVGLVESEAPGTTTSNIPNPVETMQGSSHGMYRHVEESCSCGEEEIIEADDNFLGRPVFDVSCEEHEKFRTGKNRYHRWEKYLDMQSETSQKIYQYSKKNPKQSIILRNKLGVMINAKPKTT